jgi:hypothetical protein
MLTHRMLAAARPLNGTMNCRKRLNTHSSDTVNQCEAQIVAEAPGMVVFGGRGRNLASLTLTLDEPSQAYACVEASRGAFTTLNGSRYSEVVVRPADPPLTDNS